MKWKRDIVEDPYISLTLVLLVIVGAASFYVHSYVGLGIFLLMILYFRVHQWYLLKVGEGISIGRTTKRIRLHCDEEQKWEFQLQNKGMSIWGATLKITFKDIVIPTMHPYSSGVEEKIEVSIPFSIRKNDEGSISIPVRGKRRGLCKITNMQLEIPHLFGSGKVLLDLLDNVPSTIIVFPADSPVKMAEQQLTWKQGDVPIQHSLFHDVFHQIGTRDYIQGDRFQDVHWKATARTGSLQTKIYAPATQKEWMIAINLSDRYAITNQLEEIIQYASYMMRLAVEQNITFSLVLNVRSQGGTPYYYLPPGIGRVHRQRGMEMLSTLSTDEFTIPFHIVLKHLYLRQLVPSVFIAAGALGAREEALLIKIEKQKIQVYKLNSEQKQGVVTLWKRSLKVPS
ncbi:DUF58 domain-containing protein [Rossellomorea vietnamensis]|uniref:DUF58 domain-containing protein n=1 Tax=Rossellomorea vietnamensis TaxID=218284 RepID=A0A0P6WKR2_9BACI|nr:DUF58 domain-containing protein [Rossellomorea vietnamensis]KPL61321.1 hypothetical protein AM506_01435 [Rossellomorea vietnamensis]